MPTLSSEELDDVCLRGWAIPPTPRMLENGNNYYTCSKCGNKVHPPTPSSVPEDVVSHDLDNVVHDMLNDEICLHCEHPRCIRKPKFYKEVIESIINQQIKSVLDELEKAAGEDESHCDTDRITQNAQRQRNLLRAEQRQAIQKIRSRYE